MEFQDKAITEMNDESFDSDEEREAIVEERQDMIREAIAQLIGPTEMSPEVMFHLEWLEKDIVDIKKEVTQFRAVVATVEGIRIDKIKEAIAETEEKVMKKVNFIEKLSESIQDRINECEM